MAACVREFLQITKESAYRVPMTTPTRGTDQIAIRLDGDNSFTMRASPVKVPVRYGGGYNVECDHISDKMEIKGALRTRLCYSQAEILLSMLLTRINSGQTEPWVTTEPPCQYASVCIDHAILNEDTNVTKRTRYLGVKADGGSLTVSEDSQECTLNLDLFAGKYEGNPFDASTDPNSTVFPLPDDDEYPTDYVEFLHSTMTLAGGAFLKYTSYELTAQNAHDPHYYASRFITDLRSYGRTVTQNTDIKLVATPDLRLAFEQLTPIALQLEFDNGVNTITLNSFDNALVGGLDDSLPMGTMYMRRLTMNSRYSSTGGDVLGFTFA
jgi:hypothetical protein